jgi:hypothetical protein
MSTPDPPDPKAAPDPKAVGAEIRRLLLSLRSPDHAPESGWQSYSTDALRREALDHAGFCWLAPGEMAPGCCCPWSVDEPQGPRVVLERRLAAADEPKEKP